MSKAYRCDVCGKFCSDCYEITGFDIYPDDYAERGYPNVDKKTVNYSSVKLFEVKDYWNKLTGNEEFMTLELEKILRPIIITEHTSELRGEIKRAVINNHKILKGMKFTAFIKSRGLHERWFKNG